MNKTSEISDIQKAMKVRNAIGKLADQWDSEGRHDDSERLDRETRELSLRSCATLYDIIKGI